MDDTKEFLREVSEQASDVAGTAANALGANIPEANKVSFPSNDMFSFYASSMQSRQNPLKLHTKLCV